MKRKIAVFDIDGTIFRSSLVVELVDALIEEKIFPEKLKRELEKEYVLWINRKGNYEKFIAKIVKGFKKYLIGVSEKEMKATVKKVVRKQKDKTYVFTRELVKNLKKQNYYMIAISGSPDFIVSEFAKNWGFDKYYGSIYDTKNGKFTGTGKDIAWLKSEILIDLIKENKNFDLKNSVGVGDSEIDKSFLKLIGNPIAFNPDLKLTEYAKRNKWRIVVERKNVIYELKDFKVNPTN